MELAWVQSSESESESAMAPVWARATVAAMALDSAAAMVPA